MAATPPTHASHTRLRAARSRSALLAWGLWGLSVALLLGFIPLFVATKVAASQTPMLFPVQLAHHLRPSVSDWIALPLTLMAVLAFSTLGALIITQHPENRIGWLFCAVGLLSIVEPFAAYYADYTLWVQPGSLPGGLTAAWVQNWIWAVVLGLFVVFLPLLYPTGRLLSPRWRPVGGLSAGVVALNACAAAFHPGSLWNDLEGAQLTNPLGIGAKSALATIMVDFPFGPLLLLIPISAASLLLRWRRAQGEERLQIKWFAFVGAILAGLFVTQGLVQYILALSTPAEEQLFDIVWNVALAALPLATGLAILKYHLYTLDLIINRTLVYGALTAVVIGGYILVVGSLGLVFQTSGNVLISLLATSLVAVLFQPVRAWLQRGVNRLMYGQRDEPYTVVTRLSQRLEGTLAPEAVLPTIAETVAQALKLPYAAISLRQDDAFAVVASYGQPIDHPLLLALTYQGETVGQLLLATRTPEEVFTAGDRRLLDELARHAGLAAHAVRLTAELQRSRERLVTGREEERRRLRRDLHDELGSALTSVLFKLDAADELIDRDPMAARALLTGVRAHTQASLNDIRRLVYDLRPPILDEWGLLAALREQVAQYNLKNVRVCLDAPESLPKLSAALEVAVYRVVLEALANVIKHAQATTCTIRLSLMQDALTVEVQDNGFGRGASCHAGVGVTAMRERAEELGGWCVVEAAVPHGTRVCAHFPLRKE